VYVPSNCIHGIFTLTSSILTGHEILVVENFHKQVIGFILEMAFPLLLTERSQFIDSFLTGLEEAGKTRNLRIIKRIIQCWEERAEIICFYLFPVKKRLCQIWKIIIDFLDKCPLCDVMASHVWSHLGISPRISPLRSENTIAQRKRKPTSNTISSQNKKKRKQT